MPLYHRLSGLVPPHSLVVNNLATLAVSAWWVHAFTSYGAPPPGFLLGAVLGSLFSPLTGAMTMGSVRWWAHNVVHRSALTGLLLAGYWLHGTLEAGALTTGGLWCGMAVLWLPARSWEWLLRRRLDGCSAADAGTTWYQAWVQALPETLLLGIGLTLLTRFWPDWLPSSPARWGLPLAWLAATVWLRPRLPCGLPGWLFQFGALLAVVALWAHARGVPWRALPPGLAVAAGLGLALPRWARWRQAAGGEQEPLRIAVVVAASFLLYEPIAHPVVHGSGDALWYGTVLADMLEQVRAGIFPVFGGQSAYQFNGAVFTIRIAPGFHYLGALLDGVTGQALGTFAVQNLMLVLWGMLGGLAAYGSAARLLPAHRWFAVAGAILFVACPGVMALVYSADLYMSWMTVPFVPLALVAQVDFLRRRTGRSAVLGGASLAFLWWGHTPIAVWTTLAAGLILLSGVRCVWALGWTGVGRLAIGVGVLVLGAAFPVASALLYRAEPGANITGFQVAAPRYIAELLRGEFPGVLLPLREFGRNLAAFQLGYALWLVAGLMVAWGWRRSAPRGFLLVAAGLSLLLLPWPPAATWLWQLVPDLVRDATGDWVVYRLYLPLATAVLLGAALTLAEVLPQLGGERRRQLTLAAFCLCGWSLSEGWQFGKFSEQYRRPLGSAALPLAPENIVITRYAYLVLPKVPTYFTHGMVDPEMEARLFDDDGKRIWTNRRAVLEAAARGDPRVREAEPGHFVPTDRGQPVWSLAEAFTLEPGRRYLLAFDFPDAPALHGILQLAGRRLFREYTLPLSGEPGAFGSAPGAAHALSVWTTDPQGEKFQVKFVHQGTGHPDALRRTTVRLLEYDPDLLPAQVLGWLPYRVRVRSPQPGWLETPRSYQVYWTTPRGKGDIRRSPEGLVMVRYRGDGDILELRYEVPVGFYLFFWTSALTLVGTGSYLLLGRGSPSAPGSPGLGSAGLGPAPAGGNQ